MNIMYLIPKKSYDKLNNLAQSDAKKVDASNSKSLPKNNHEMPHKEPFNNREVRISGEKVNQINQSSFEKGGTQNIYNMCADNDKNEDGAPSPPPDMANNSEDSYDEPDPDNFIQNNFNNQQFDDSTGANISDNLTSPILGDANVITPPSDLGIDNLDGNQGDNLDLPLAAAQSSSTNAAPLINNNDKTSQLEKESASARAADISPPKLFEEKISKYQTEVDKYKIWQEQNKYNPKLWDNFQKSKDDEDSTQKNKPGKTPYSKTRTNMSGGIKGKKTQITTSKQGNQKIATETARAAASDKTGENVVNQRKKRSSTDMDPDYIPPTNAKNPDSGKSLETRARAKKTKQANPNNPISVSIPQEENYDQISDVRPKKQSDKYKRWE